MSVPELTPQQAMRLKRAIWRACGGDSLPDGCLLLTVQVTPYSLTYTYVIPADTPQPAQRVTIPLGDGWWT